MPLKPKGGRGNGRSGNEEPVLRKQGERRWGMKRKTCLAVGVLSVLAGAHAFVGLEGLDAGWFAELVLVPYAKTRFFSAGAFALSAMGVAFGKRWVAASALPIALANVLWRFCSGDAPSEVDGEWVLVALSCLAFFVALYAAPLLLLAGMKK